MKLFNFQIKFGHFYYMKQRSSESLFIRTLVHYIKKGHNSFSRIVPDYEEELPSVPF